MSKHTEKFTTYFPFTVGDQAEQYAAINHWRDEVSKQGFSFDLGKDPVAQVEMLKTEGQPIAGGRVPSRWKVEGEVWREDES